MINEEKIVAYILSLILIVFTLHGCIRKTLIQQEMPLSTNGGSSNTAIANTIIEEGNKIKIVTPSGEVIKEISLVEEERLVDSPNQSDGYTQKVKKHIIKRAVFSRDKKYIGLVVNEHDISLMLIGKDGKEEEISFEGEGQAEGRLTIYNLEGKVVFYREMPPKRWLHFEPLISDNLESIVVYTQWTGTEGGRDVEKRDIVYVFDRGDKEKMIFPTEQEYKDGYIISNIPHVISQNGRYLAIDIERHLVGGPATILTRFYDLENKTYWDSAKKYLIWDIGDDGIADVRDSDTEETFKINLMQYMTK